MGYCTVADIRGKVPERDLIQWTDDERLGQVDEARIDTAIAEVSALMDGYLAARYTVPVNPASDVLKTIAIPLVLFELSARLGGKLDEAIKTRRDAAMTSLKDIGGGRLILSGAAASEPETTGGGASTNVTAGGQVFTRSTMEGF